MRSPKDSKGLRMELSKIYDLNFYNSFKKNKNMPQNSAKIIIKYVSDILPPLSSVLDVGCGTGKWLKEWQALNPNIDVLGIDVNECQEDTLDIPREKIIIANLEQKNIGQLINKHFDLVESLEVGEHINECNADIYVDLLCSLGDFILFSAAPRGQRGTHHINCQNTEFWYEKFKAHGFECFDIIRQNVWNNDNISWWYRQNILLYAKSDGIEYLKQKTGMKPTVPLTLYKYENLYDMIYGLSYSDITKILKFKIFESCQKRIKILKNFFNFLK